MWLVSKPKKVARRRQRKAKATKAVVKTSGNNPFPDRYLTKLRYIDDISANPALPYVYHVFRANSLYDPDYNNIGRNGQPMGFDTLCGAPKGNTPYFTYTVKDCYIRLDIVNMSTTMALYAVIWPSKEVSTPGTATEAFEQAYSKYCIIPQSGSINSKRLFKKFSTKKMFGEDNKTVDTEDNYSAAYNASPTDGWAWNIYFYSADGVSNVNVRYKLELIYSAEFSDRNQLVQS